MSIYPDCDLKRFTEQIKSSKEICKFNKDKILEHTIEQSVNGMADASRVYYLWMLRDLSLGIQKPFPLAAKNS